jgi:hypothetical protein
MGFREGVHRNPTSTQCGQCKGEYIHKRHLSVFLIAVADFVSIPTVSSFRKEENYTLKFNQNLKN